jgi:hypothetical protein
VFYFLNAKFAKNFAKIISFLNFLNKQNNTILIFKNKIMNENELSKIVIGCAIKVHSELGPGLLESAYEECLYYVLKKEGLFVEKQKPMPLI